MKIYPNAEFISVIVGTLKLSSKNPEVTGSSKQPQKDAVGGIVLRQKSEVMFKLLQLSMPKLQ